MVVLSDPSLIESLGYFYLKCFYFKHVLTVVARSILGSYLAPVARSKPLTIKARRYIRPLAALNHN